VNVGAFALRHANVLVATLLVAALGGVFAARSLASGIYPEVDFPRIVVVARGGDDPADVFETQVTRPLEQALVTVLGVRRVRARTIRGSTEISLQFVPGSDMWRSLQFVQAQVNNARGTLPAGLEVEVERLTPTTFPVVTFNLAGNVDPRDLHDLGELVLRPALARVPGVGQVRVLGGDVREIEVIIDPGRAAAARLRPTEIAARVRDAVTFGAVGRMRQDRELVTALASGEVRSPAELAQVPLALTASGTPIPLSSVATVTEGSVDRTSSVGGPRGETVLVSVSRVEGASTPDVVRAVQEAARDVARSFPAGVTLEVVYDQAALVEDSTASVRDAILIGVLLCLLVLGFSLKDARAGLVAAAAVPLVLATTFLVMKTMHQTLNLMSLGGMAVSIGLVIDDAIIVVEAIAHRLEQGETPSHAAAAGTSDLAAAVFGTTVTTVIVFVPLAFVSGMVGDFFSALAGTLSVAVLLSLVVSLTAVPVFASRWMRQRPVRTDVPALQRLYGRVADWGARRAWVGPLCVAVAVAGTALAARSVSSGFLPTMDEGAFILDYYLPPATSLEETVATARQIERVLAATPEVRTFSRRTGAELGPVAATLLSRGDIMVRLKDRRSRDVEAVIGDLRGRLEEEVPAARYEFVQVLQDVLNDLSGAPRPVEIKFFGADRAVLEPLAREAARRLGHVHGIADLYDGIEPATPTLVYRVQRDAAARLGRTSRDVFDELGASLAGVLAGTLRRFDRLVNIRVRYPDAVRFDPERVAALPLLFGASAPAATADAAPAASGVLPISAAARPERQSVPAVLVREGLLPVVIVTADYEGGDLGAVMRDARAALSGMPVPAGYRMEVGGLYASQQETFGNLAMVALFGVVLTLLVLIAQFRRVLPAVAVLLTVPFALFGAMVTLWVTRTPLNASSLMGCVLLVGLEVKSGILLLEVAEDHAAEGMAYLEALSVAARRRIRPIMLTTTATMFGVLPLALGLGAGAEIQRPLAVAVLGGIVLSKFMNLVALPSLAAALGPRPRRTP
jgi:multidrug efflux pump subunit AcrB